MTTATPRTAAGRALLRGIRYRDQDGYPSLLENILAIEAEAGGEPAGAGLHRQHDELGHCSNGKAFHDAICQRCGLMLAYLVRDQVECLAAEPAGRCDRIVNSGMGEPTECGRTLPCEYHDPAEPAGAGLREALAEAIMAVEAKHRYTDDAAGQQGRIELRLHGTDTDADWLAGELLRYLPALPAEPAPGLRWENWRDPFPPAALDVERLARALALVYGSKGPRLTDHEYGAAAIAAAYEGEK